MKLLQRRNCDLLKSNWYVWARLEPSVTQRVYTQKQLKLSGEEMPRDDKVAILKDSLAAIGRRIEAVLNAKEANGEDRDRWRRHLWTWVSKYAYFVLQFLPSPFQLDSSLSSGPRKSKLASWRKSMRRWSWRKLHPGPKRTTMHPKNHDWALVSKAMVHPLLQLQLLPGLMANHIGNTAHYIYLFLSCLFIRHSSFAFFPFTLLAWSPEIVFSATFALIIQICIIVFGSQLLQF